MYTRDNPRPLSSCLLPACPPAWCSVPACLQADDPDSVPVLDILGIDVLPTVQFWREGKLLWEHRGVNQLEQNMGEGVLYFGDRCAGGEFVRALLAGAVCLAGVGRDTAWLVECVLGLQRERLAAASDGHCTAMTEHTSELSKRRRHRCHT